jgi:nucleoside-diphosphate-sugar epimerase
MKILVTGGSGYVGSLLVPKLLELNYKVIVIDTFWYGDFLKKNKNLKKIKKNILDLKTNDLKGIDGVIHLAGIANDTSSNLIPKLTWEITCLGTKILCDVSKKNKIQFFLYASSSSVYGVKKEQKVHEELSCKPISDYNKTILLEKFSYLDGMLEDNSKAKLNEWINWGLKISDYVMPLEVSFNNGELE